MNQDFLMNGGPGAARNLARLAAVSNVTIDPSIFVLATTGMVEFGEHEVTADEKTAIQSLTDYDFRAVFPTGGKHWLVLLAAKLANISPIFIMSRSPREWFKKLHEYGYVHNETYFIVQPSRKKEGIDPDMIRDRRHGLLIIDDMISAHEMQLMSRDFPKTVVATNRRLITDLSDLIGSLFPGAPTDVLTNVNAFFKRDVESMGFTTTRPADLAFLMNVVTDLMVIAKEVDVDPSQYADLDVNTDHGHLRHG